MWRWEWRGGELSVEVGAVKVEVGVEVGVECGGGGSQTRVLLVPMVLKMRYPIFHQMTSARTAFTGPNTHTRTRRI